MRQPIRYTIPDKQLEKEYDEREKYCFIKRLYIEHKYNKAVEKEIVKSFEKIHKKDI